jgi:hypothetical protein
MRTPSWLSSQATKTQSNLQTGHVHICAGDGSTSVHVESTTWWDIMVVNRGKLAGEMLAVELGFV